MQHRSFNAAPRKRPYIVLRSSLANSEIRDDGVSLISATHHRLFVHDEPGSYLKIDAIVDEIRGAIESATADGNLVKGEWLETSEDLEDPDMGTILRWCRVRLVHRT